MATHTRGAPSRSVFIGNIPWDATEDQLRQICEEVGPIVSLRMVLDKETRKPKGFAFAEYLDEETAESARRNLHGYEINGRLLRVGEPTGEKNAERRAQESVRPTIDLPDPGPPLGSAAAAVAASTMAAALGGGQSAPGGGMPGGDPLAATMAGMGQQQLFSVLATMKAMIQQNPTQARQILLAKPDLTKSLFFAQISLGMVRPPPAPSSAHLPIPTPTQEPQPARPLPPAPPLRPPSIIAATAPAPPLPPAPAPPPSAPRPPPGPPPPSATSVPTVQQWHTPQPPPLPQGLPFAAQPQQQQTSIARGPAPPPGPPPMHAQTQQPQQLYPVAPLPLHSQPVPPLAPRPPPLPPTPAPTPPQQRPLLPTQTQTYPQQGLAQPPLPQTAFPAQPQQSLPIPPNLPPNMVAIYTRLLSISEAEVNALPPDAQVLARSIRQSARNQANA